jgi:hypothetical protein
MTKRAPGRRHDLITRRAAAEQNRKAGARGMMRGMALCAPCRCHFGSASRSCPGLADRRPAEAGRRRRPAASAIGAAWPAGGDRRRAVIDDRLGGVSDRVRPRRVHHRGRRPPTPVCRPIVSVAVPVVAPTVAPAKVVPATMVAAPAAVEAPMEAAAVEASAMEAAPVPPSGRTGGSKRGRSDSGERCESKHRLTCGHGRLLFHEGPLRPSMIGIRRDPSTVCWPSQLGRRNAVTNTSRGTAQRGDGRAGRIGRGPLRTTCVPQSRFGERGHRRAQACVCRSLPVAVQLR